VWINITFYYTRWTKRLYQPSLKVNGQ